MDSLLSVSAAIRLYHHVNLEGSELLLGIQWLDVVAPPRGRDNHRL